MKRIIHESNQLAMGGSEEIVRCIVKYDKENEHTVLTYQDGPMRKPIEDAGGKVIVSQPKIDIDLNQFDIVHLHNGGMYSNLLSQNGNSKLKFIETIHSPVFSPHPDNLIIQRIGNSNAVTKMNKKCKTILNGVDFKELEMSGDIEGRRVEIKKEIGIESDLPVVGRLGRLASDKWLEEWVLICYYAQQEVDFIPLIVGPETQKNYLGKVKLMIESLPLKNVIFTGARQDKANMYNIMDIFLYPSPTEGFGLVFLEAMYFGLPIISLETEVTKEVLGSYGYLMKWDLKKMVEVLVDLIKKRNKEVVSQEVLEYFSAQRMVKDYQEVYREIH